MLRKLLSMVFVIFFVITFTSSASAAMGDHDSMPTTNMPQMHMPAGMQMMPMHNSRSELRDGMRKLWTDHIVWTRTFIISSVANMPEAGLNAERLLKNQEEIGTAIKPYYGNAAGEKLTDLLKTHIAIAADIVTLAKNGDMEGLSSKEMTWINNADDIAMFLSSANPNWLQKDLQDMLHQHLSLTKSELMARINNDYSRDIQTFDAIYTQALMMADTLSNGIMKQFPEQFNMMQGNYTVKISMTPELGPFLVDSQGKTLYYFMKDMPLVSNCKGKCPEVWPPFFAEKIIVPKMLNPKDFGMITRDDGMMQTTYKDWPLYYFSKDEKANDIKGQGFNNLWFVIKVNQ